MSLPYCCLRRVNNLYFGSKVSIDDYFFFDVGFENVLQKNDFDSCSMLGTHFFVGIFIYPRV